MEITIISRMKQKLSWLLWYFYDFNFKYYCHKFFTYFKYFKFKGKKYEYFSRKYNTAWFNERTVEAPIIWREVKECRGRKILEVGNVLSHYFVCNHDVLDKYEKGSNVINQDVVDFSPQKKYDLIVSISTLEHVGWDEKPEKPKKILRAIKNLKTLLSKKGKIIVTLPLGFNAELDKMLKEKKIRFKKMHCMKRCNKENEWTETDWKEIKNAKYNHPFNGANGLIIGVIEK